VPQIGLISGHPNRPQGFHRDDLGWHCGTRIVSEPMPRLVLDQALHSHAGIRGEVKLVVPVFPDAPTSH